MASKTQFIRLLDVGLFGPYMLWSARNVKHEYFRTGLMLVGWGTILYNGYNLLREAAEQAGSPLQGARRGLVAPPLDKLNRYSVNLVPRHRRPRRRRIRPRSETRRRPEPADRVPPA